MLFFTPNDIGDHEYTPTQIADAIKTEFINVLKYSLKIFYKKLFFNSTSTLLNQLNIFKLLDFRA